jgi:hypothetical protein
MNKLVPIFFICFAFSVSSQTVRRDRTSPFTIRGNIGIQKPLTSAQFAKSFAGLLEANISFNARVAGELSVGLGYQNTNFKNNQFLKYKAFNTNNTFLPYQTSLICNAGFMRIGYDQFWKTNRFISWALNTGYMACQYTNVNNDTSSYNQPIQEKTFSAPYLQPELTVNFVMEQRLAFSLLFSYTTVLYKYDARAPRLAQFEEIHSKGDKFIMSYINFGFGFTVLLGK